MNALAGVKSHYPVQNKPVVRPLGAECREQYKTKMSANNHDSGDPNNVKYAKVKLTTSEEQMGFLIKIYQIN